MLKANIQEIIKRRNQIGESQKEISRRAGLPVNAVYRIESGETKQTQYLRAREIAKALDCKVEDIFTPVIKGE